MARAPRSHHRRRTQVRSVLSPPSPPSSSAPILTYSTTYASGILTYRELTRAGFSAHIYERDSHPGGNWHYTEQTPVDAPVPNAPVEVGDYVPSLPPRGVELPYTVVGREGGWEEGWREFRAPKPVWASLRSNAPAVSVFWV